MLDLKHNQYDSNTLKAHIYEIDLWDILKTQKITEDFAWNYILNKNYQLTEEEQTITIREVLFFQPHLYNTNLLVKHRTNSKKCDSWNEFEKKLEIDENI